MNPLLDHRGLLPPGIHAIDWPALAEHFTRTPRREMLLQACRLFVQNHLSGLPGTLYLTGSFASDKTAPGDIDLTLRADIECCNADQLRRLILLDASHEQFMAQYEMDFYVTYPGSGSDFVRFFQYVGPKSATIKQLDQKEERGIIEVMSWQRG